MTGIAAASHFQGSLFAVDGADTSRDGVADLGREDLGDGAWLDRAAAWCPEPDALFEELLRLASWRAERRPMYDRMVDVPRLVAHYERDEPLPGTRLAQLSGLVDQRYAADLGERLCGVGLCLYRDGQDSVAWHGDTLGRGATQDTVVAIVSLGAERTFALRPRGGGPSRRFPVGHGDLIAMGGSCQRTWEHAIPKTAREGGPRISIQFRAHGVR